MYFKNYNYEPQCFYLENVNNVLDIQISISDMNGNKQIKHDNKCIMIIEL